MGELLPQSGVPKLASLFATPERWGWEFRPPSPFLRPYPLPAPALQTPSLTWVRPALVVESLSRLRMVLLTVAVALVGTTVLLRGSQQRLPVTSTSSGPSAADHQSAVEAARVLHVVTVSTVVAMVAAGLAVLAVLAARWRARRSLDEWLACTVIANAEHERAHARWAADAAEHAAAESDALVRRPSWYPVCPPGLRRLDVFGGTPEGWQDFLVSAGTSLLAANGWLGVIDLSGDRMAGRLLDAARQHGRPTDILTLPADAETLDALAGLGPAAVADLLAEMVHAHEASDGVDPAPAGVDARVLGGVCAALDAPLTIGRICAGLRVLLQQEPLPGAGSALTEVEYDQVAAAFSDTLRRGVEQRIVTLEAILYQLAEVGARPVAPPVEGAVPPVALQVVQVATDTPRLPAALLVQLLLQLLLARAGRVGGPGSRTLILVGADLLRKRHLDRLQQLSARAGVRLVCMFRHIHDETTRWLGTADVVYLMRLGNATEAAAAAEFVGREHKLLLHGLTLTATAGGSGSIESSMSTQYQRGVTVSYGGSGRSASRGESRSTGASTGTSTSIADAATRQRVYEFAVEPTVFQSLPPTAFVYVETGRRGGPRARVGDCDPRIGSLPTTAAGPARRESTP